MESLVEDKKKQKAPERICLGQEEVVKVDAWLMQVNESSRGFLTLSKSDIANWAIRSHREELSSKELSQIRQYHYDPIRHINWILPQIKEALLSGDTARVAILQEELRGVELSVIGKAMEASGANNSAPPKQKRKSKKSKSDEIISSEITDNSNDSS